MIRHSTAVASAITLFVLAALLLTGNVARSQQGGFDAISVDMDPSGNTASSLDARQECREALPGAEITVDVTVEGISPSTPLFGYDYVVTFSGPDLTVTSREPIKIDDEPGSQLFDVSDPVPQFGGEIHVSIIDIGESQAYEHGSGVLDRFTFDVATDAGPGVYVIGITAAILLDQESEPHSPPLTRNARLAIGVSCAGSTSLPEVTASVTPVPSEPTEPTGGTIAPTGNGSATLEPEPSNGTSTPSTTGETPPSPTPTERPTASAANGDDDGGGSAQWIAAAVVAIVIVGGVGALWAYRRYATG